MSYISRLAELWKVEDWAPDPVAAGHAVTRFERRFGVKLPQDVAAFYSRFYGSIGSMDADLNCFWEIDDIDTVSATVAPYYRGTERIPNRDNLFAFADHSIWVCVYAMELTFDSDTEAPIVWIANDEFAPLAPTFAEFWEMYLTSEHRILFS